MRSARGDGLPAAKGWLVEAPVFTYPDPSRQYVLDTDTSNDAAGAVLLQMVEGEECVVAYYSKTFSPLQ